MSKLLVVFGATGQQGSSVVKQVLKDARLRQEFKIRGITRDTSKPSAQALAVQGVEMVSGDMDSHESLRQVLAGAHSVFATTMSLYEENGKEREIAQGKAIADATVAAGAQQLIWSTTSSSKAITGGKIQVHSWDSKWEVEQYIRTLDIQSAFVAPGSFMQNFISHRRPRPLGDGTYAIFNWIRPDARMTLVDIVDDMGKYVGAILAEPKRFHGKILYAAGDLLTMDEIAADMSEKTGKIIKYKQLPRATYQGYMDPITGKGVTDMYELIQDYGYFGSETEKLVADTAKEVGVRLNTFKDALDAAMPISLD